jgi:hypothetical protein
MTLDNKPLAWGDSFLKESSTLYRISLVSVNSRLSQRDSFPAGRRHSGVLFSRLVYCTIA